MKWSVDLFDTTEGDSILLADLAAPTEENGKLIFAGRVLTVENTAMRLTIRYGSEQLAQAQVTTAFRLVVPKRPGLYRVELQHPAGGRRVWDVVDQDMGPYTLPGLGQQLFLAGDSNDSLAQYTVSRNLSEASAKAWDSVFEAMPGWRDSFGLDHIGVLIAPAKEENFRDLYPRPRAQRTVVDDFLARFGEKGPIFPKWQLWNRRELAWSRNDTHWTDFGATVAAGEVLKAWGLPTTGLPEEFRVVQRIGDLGGKMEPRVSSHEMAFPTPVPARKVFDNGVDNQGCIRIYRNADAPQPGGLLIFGDSFGTNLVEAFSGVFAETAFAYQPAGFDPALVAALRPRHVLLQITQRFLHGQPATGLPVFGKAREKIAALPPEKAKALRDRLAATEGDHAALAQAILAG